MSNTNQEVIKLTAVLLAFAWIPFLFINTTLAMIMLIGAVALTGYRVMKGASERDARRAEATKHHDELMTATQKQAAPVVEKSVAERLGSLELLKEQGLITDAEYTETRSAILDDV